MRNLRVPLASVSHEAQKKLYPDIICVAAVPQLHLLFKKSIEWHLYEIINKWYKKFV